MKQAGYTLHRKNDPFTSRAAAMAILEQLPVLQQQVYAYAYAQGTDGFTDDDMMDHFGSIRSTYRTRRSELTRAGLIVDTGRTRVLPTRRQATVWAIVDPEEVV
jgi:hypothetical protein